MPFSFVFCTSRMVWPLLTNAAGYRKCQADWKTALSERRQHHAVHSGLVLEICAVEPYWVAPTLQHPRPSDKRHVPRYLPSDQLHGPRRLSLRPEQSVFKSLKGPPRAAAKAIVTIAERTVDVLDYLTMGEFVLRSGRETALPRS